jgi:pimeloyl-ACP methyl ester carboxylesterase
VLAVLDFGPPERAYDLVFLHANGFNALTYRRVLAPLAADFRILALDQRGHGASSLTTVIEGRTDWGDFRDDLVLLLETLDLRGRCSPDTPWAWRPA